MSSVSSIGGLRSWPGVGSAQHSCVRYCRVVFSVCQNPQKSVGIVPARTPPAHNKKNNAFMFQLGSGFELPSGSIECFDCSCFFLKRAFGLNLALFCHFALLLKSGLSMSIFSWA